MKKNHTTMKDIPSDALYFSSLLVARLCHDLISPLNAVSTGIELLQDAPTTDSQDILNLVSHSATVVGQRASFFRSAFGLGAFLSFDEAKELLEMSFQNENFSFCWTQKTDLPPSRIKILLNAVFCLNMCAPRGGILTISASKKDLALRLDANILTLSQENEEILMGLFSLDDITPHTVPYASTALLIKEEKLLCSLDRPQDKTLILTIS